MDINQAENLAVKLMSQHGLIQKGWRFKFDRALRRNGHCSEFTKTISLSKIKVSQNEEHLIRNTILHEIAHALVGCRHGHDYVWKNKAIEIGCTGERCTSGYISIEGKYKGICPNGHESTRHRKPRTERSCSKCSSKFDRRFLITYSENN